MKKLLPLILLTLFAGSSYGQVVFSPNGTGRTGTIQEYIVPLCVTEVSIECFGAQGGNVNGGLGARMKGNFPVNFGDTLFIVVGQQGVINNCGGSNASAGGGGGSFVWKGTGLNRTLLIVAGGGGGGNTNWSDPNCMLGIDADTLQDGTQGNGVNSAMGGTNGDGGFGNAPSGTGSGGAGWLTNGENSTYGSGCTGGDTYPLFTGGFGASVFGPGGEGGFGGGGGAVCGNGGGGGYSGGGGGEGASCRAGGGGGGSYNIGTNQSNSRSVQSGDGQVLIDVTGSGLTVTTTITPNDTVCEGTLVTLTGSGADLYSWDNGITNGVPFTAIASQSYTLVGQDSTGTCTDTVSVGIVVNPLPVLSLLTGGRDTVCADASAINLTGTPAGGIFGGTGVSGSNFNPAAAALGWNVVTYAYTDANGCAAAIEDSIYVRACLGIDPSNANTIQVEVFPNPASDYITINTGILVDKITVYDALGRILHAFQPVAPVSVIDLKNYRNGLYILDVQAGGANSRLRIIKE